MKCAQCEAEETLQREAMESTATASDGCVKEVKLLADGQNPCPAVQGMSHPAVPNKFTHNSNDLISPESRSAQHAESQDWFELACAAIKDERFQDALKAYDEGIKLSPNIAPDLDRHKLNILAHHKQAAQQLENKEEASLKSDNEIQIAQSDPGEFSNLPPWAERDNQNDEEQRKEAIRDQAGILGTLYQGGNPEKRAFTFEERRTEDRTAVPLMDKSEKMGPWISQYRWWIRDLLQKNGCPPRGVAPAGAIGPQRPLNVPFPNPYYPERRS